LAEVGALESGILECQHIIIDGAKGAVGSGFDSVKRAVGKSGLMGGILNPFGDIDVLDELKDQWTHESKVNISIALSPLASTR